MNSGVFVTLVVGFVLFLGLTLLFGFFGKKKKKEPYDLLSYFPYELYEDSRGFYFAFARLFEGLFLLLGLASAGLEIASFVNYDSSVFYFVVWIGATSGLSAVGELALTLIPVGHPKAHTALYVLYSTAVTIRSGMVGFFLLSLGKDTNVGSLVCSIVLFAIAALVMLLLANPKMSSWAKMEAVATPEGEIQYRRPRPFVLAFSEWLAIFLDAVSIIVTLLGFFLLAF
jgi:hypothetical protein